MLKPNYKVLFHFENEKIEIVEIKRSGVLSEDKSKVYHWLLYDKFNDMLTHLVFKSITSDPDKEFRVFEDSLLNFDKKEAQFTEKGKTQKLRIVNVDTLLSQKLKEAIGDYLLLQNFKI